MQNSRHRFSQRVPFVLSFSIKMVKGLFARKETEFLRSGSNRLWVRSRVERRRGEEGEGGGGGRVGVREEKKGKRVREIWNMGTEMQIFVRKLITRINSSQNVQTVCQTGRFYLFSRRQTELVRTLGRSSECVVACARVLPRTACTVCVCTRTRAKPLPSRIRVLRRIGIKFTRQPDILFRPTDCKRIL